MEDISDITFTDFIPSFYTAPCTMYYKQNDKQRKWNIFAERNGVVIIVYNKTKDVLVLVKQFRPSVYFQQIPDKDRQEKVDTAKHPAKIGITLEWCAGLEDKVIPTDQIAKEEILEECGYEVTLDQLEKIGTIKNLSTTTGARSTFYYCEVTEEMRVNEGGGEQGENCEVLEMPVEDVIKYASHPEYVSSPINFMYGLYWFMFNKYNRK
ncbi:hypothetical protein NQ317_012254 [Molorchus minor]|uniref:Nudix hydrolase domain-containing protein n=1 Tax=Molorchus minor TaxID=1323400 RepID=A0ABQ9K171_9CUCU|nr:hypothetical protein NQ317_012254 [Molorchus minor]